MLGLSMHRSPDFGALLSVTLRPRSIFRVLINCHSCSRREREPHPAEYDRGRRGRYPEIVSIPAPKPRGRFAVPSRNTASKVLQGDERWVACGTVRAHTAQPAPVASQNLSSEPAFFLSTRRRRKLVALHDVPAVVPRTLQLLAVNSAQGRALRLRATLEKRFSFPASRPGPRLGLG